MLECRWRKKEDNTKADKEAGEAKEEMDSWCKKEAMDGETKAEMDGETKEVMDGETKEETKEEMDGDKVGLGI